MIQNPMNLRQTLQQKKSKQTKPTFPKFQPVPIPLEERKFCVFHVVPEIPVLVCALPQAHGLTGQEVEALQSPCKGSALFGVVNPPHPLYGARLFCERHSRRKYYQLYGDQRCPPDFSHKCPNLAQVCIQGAGGRPVIEEGKVQTNAQHMKRSRSKKKQCRTRLMLN